MSMNRNNILRLRRDGVQPHEQSNHVALARPGGRTFVVSKPPGGWTDSDEFSRETAHFTDADLQEFAEAEVSGTIATRALKIMAVLDAKTAEVRGLSDLAKLTVEQRLDAPRTEALQGIAKQAAAIRDHQRALAAQEVELYAAPARDELAALDDQELREDYLRKGGPQLTAARNSLDTSAGERLLLALIRSPIDLGSRDGPIVREAWRASVAARKPEQAKRLEDAQAAANWCQDDVVKPVVQAVRVTTNLSNFEIWKRVGLIDGAEIFEFQPHELRGYEARHPAA